MEAAEAIGWVRSVSEELFGLKEAKQLCQKQKNFVLVSKFCENEMNE